MSALPRAVAIDGLRIEYGPGVLEPRPWTAMQGCWAAALLAALPPGPVLELCCGAGHIGLVAARASGRRVIQVDVDERACTAAARNARANGLSELVQVRHGPLDGVLRPSERFPLVIADPPYVRSAEVGEFPHDPTSAIDGGPDGLDLARDCVSVAHRHLLNGGALLLQLCDTAQAAALSGAVRSLQMVDLRTWGPRRVVACYRSQGLNPDPCG